MKLPVLIIVGCGKGVWDELNQLILMLEAYEKKYELMAINLAIFGLEAAKKVDRLPLVHWASVHPEYFVFKRLHGYMVATHSNKPGPGVDYVWNNCNTGGGSALWATKIAIEHLHKTHIILVGVPMDSKGRFYDSPWSQYPDYNAFGSHHPWQISVEDFQNKVRSMSGYTKELLGEPTLEWLNA